MTSRQDAGNSGEYRDHAGNTNRPGDLPVRNRAQLPWGTSRRCVDIASEYCPCYRGVVGECLVCSILQGADECDCLWQGVCVLLNYRRVLTAPRTRTEVCLPVVDHQVISAELVRLTLQVDRGILPLLRFPGTYIFARPAGSPTFSSAPYCVMDTFDDPPTITTVVRRVGPKSRMLANDASEANQVIVRGPFWGGILGREAIARSEQSETLVLGYGIGQVSVVKVVEYLLRRDNRVTAIVDDDKTPGLNISSKLQACGCFVGNARLGREPGERFLQELLRDDCFDLIYAAGPDWLYGLLFRLKRELGLTFDLAVSNNHVLCCGEGLCGSCHTSLADGGEVPMCKCQPGPDELYDR